MRRLCILLAVLATVAMVPKFAMANDSEVAELNQKVAEQIASDLDISDQLNGCSVTVRYQNGVVWLRGNVFRVSQRESASSIVLDTPGVTRVVNELQIVQDASNQVLAQTPGALQPELHPESTLGHWSGPASHMAMNNGVVPVVAMEEGLPSTPPAPIALADPMLPAPAISTRVPTATYASAMVQEDLPAPLSIPSSMPMQQPVPMTQAAPVSNPQCIMPSRGGQSAPMRYDTPNVPNYAWPSYAASPHMGNVGYPRQYEASAWPYIGPFYPYPQVPMGWRKVTIEWHDGGWYADFDDGTSNSRSPFSAFFRPHR